MEGNSVPRMRTIQQCADYFKSNDPQTQITYWKIRGLVLDGEVPYVSSGKTGRTKYINLDLLINYLNNESTQPQPRLIKPVRLNRG